MRKTQKYKECDNVYCTEELPPANILSKLIELSTCTTYPPNILARRVNLLTKNEKIRVDKKWNKITNLFEEIDYIIATRAEISKDPWKIIKKP